MSPDVRHKVMVRMLREDATPSEQRCFLSEAKPYRDLKHPNVLRLVGRCLENNPYLVILEACSGVSVFFSFFTRQGLCSILCPKNIDVSDTLFGAYMKCNWEIKNPGN